MSDKHVHDVTESRADLTHTTDLAPADLTDPALTRFDLIQEGARRDGVEIVHYRPKFPIPGTKAEKRIERSIAAMLAITGLSATAFVVIYVAWPWQYAQGAGLDKLYTPLLGLTMGLALVAIGVAVVLWAKKLLPEEISIQDRHDDPSDSDERLLTGATMLHLVDETGIKRRPLLKAALVFGALPLGAMAAVPLGALISDPHKNSRLFHTGFTRGVRLVREDGTPIRPEDVSPGGMLTVFPGIPDGATNKYASSPTLLFHLHSQDAEKATNSRLVPDGNYGAFIAYSKICTHAGCPASLYQQRDHLLLCPCHQSQFDVLDGCRPIFGPASRPLPQLPIEVDGQGYFVAKSDYKEAIGPAFWERP